MKNLIAILALTSALAAQSRPAGTGTLAGRVMRDSTPVARALVSIDAGDGRAERVTATNDAGEFVFSDLPAGRYLVNASKHGWVTTHYGSPRAGRPPGTRVAVDAGARASISVPMTPGAVIAGRMIDNDGAPAVHAFPILLESRFVGDRQVIARVNLPYDVGFFEQMTDDRGEFRLYGLPPGTYYLVATPRTRIGSARITTADEVRWATQPPDPKATPPPVGPLANTNAPIFFPGTPDASQAQAIVLGPGEVRDRLTYRLVNVAFAKVAGFVRTSDGSPPCASVRLEEIDSKVMLEGLGPRAGVDRNTGAFSINEVPPGEYRAVAQSVPCGGMGGSAEAAAPQQPRQPNYPVYWGQATIRVAGQDVSGLSITMAAASSVTGRIAFDGKTIQPPADLLSVRLLLMTTRSLGAAAAGIYQPGTSHNATVSADGSFKVDGLPPDRYLVGASWPNMRGADRTSGWWLTSVKVGDRDLGVEPIDVQPGTNLTGVVVTFRDRIGAIEGQITDAAGKGATGYVVMAFPVDRAAWTSQRTVPPAPVGTDGHYRLVGLHAGEYYLAVVTAVSESDAVDPAFLSLIVPSAVKVSVGDGETKRHDLKIAR